MLQPAARDDVAGVGQRLDDGLVGVALLALVVDDALALEAGRMRGERAVLVDGVGNRGIDAARFELARVRGPDFEVLAAVARRGVHEAGAGVVGDVVAGEERHVEVVAAFALEADARNWIRKIAAGYVVDLLVGCDPRCLEHIGRKLVGENKRVAGLCPIVGRRFGDFDRGRRRSSARS